MRMLDQRRGAGRLLRSAVCLVGCLSVITVGAARADGDSPASKEPAEWRRASAIRALEMLEDHWIMADVGFIMSVRETGEDTAEVTVVSLISGWGQTRPDLVGNTCVGKRMLSVEVIGKSAPRNRRMGKKRRRRISRAIQSVLADRRIEALALGSFILMGGANGRRTVVSVRTKYPGTFCDGRIFRCRLGKDGRILRWEEKEYHFEEYVCSWGAAYGGM